MFTVTTKSDIETWIANYRYDVVAEGLQEALTGAIQSADHPPYGSDWENWLDANVEPLLTAILEDEP
jgi:hypothetical protein